MAYGLRDAGIDQPGLALRMVFEGIGRPPRRRPASAPGRHRTRRLSTVVIEPDGGGRLPGRFRGLLGGRAQYHLARQLSGETGAHDVDWRWMDGELRFRDANDAGSRLR